MSDCQVISLERSIPPERNNFQQKTKDIVHLNKSACVCGEGMGGTYILIQLY